MNDSKSAAEALSAAAIAALRNVGGFASVQETGPIQAAVPWAAVETGLETDWGHKSGAGREVRLSVTIRDEGERPDRLRRLTAAAEGAIAGIQSPVGGWRIVTFALLRIRTVRERDGWSASSDWRARMLAEA